MTKIEKVEMHMVDLVPMMKRTDGNQRLVSQETPIVIFNAMTIKGAA